MSTNKKILRPFIIISIILMSFNSAISIAQAKDRSKGEYQSTPSPVPTPTPLPEIQMYVNSATFSFEDVGQDDIVLYYPDSTSFDINLPDYWKMKDYSSEIVFHYDFEFTVSNRPELSAAAEAAIEAGQLPVPVEVLVNNIFVGSFFPTAGKDQQIRFSIPAEVFETLNDPLLNPTNTYNIELGFYLSADIYCGLGAIITIFNDSLFNLNFALEPQFRDLSYLPRMIVQGSFAPETVVFVIPDNYTDADLTSVATMAAFIGSSFLGDVSYRIIKASEVKGNTLDSYSAIIIGQPVNNSYIAELYQRGLLPTTIGIDGSIFHGGTPIAATDGVIQIIPSPFNELNTFLIITGNNDEGILLASKEVAKTTAGLSSDVYIFHPPDEAVAESPAEMGNTYNILFSELIFSTRVFRGPGTTETSLSFYVPRNWEIQPGAKIVVNYNYSSRLGISSSGLSVSLNGYPLGSVPFDATIHGDRTEEVQINPGFLNRGSINTLVFTATRRPEYECINIDPDILWITLRDNSLLEIPYRTIENAYGIAPFTNPFFYLANEGNLLVSIPQDPSSEDLDNIVGLISTLGASSFSPTPLTITMTRDAVLDESQQKDNNLLVYGRQSQNSVLAKLNDEGVLIQPFVKEKDVLMQQKANVEIHTPQDMDIGLIQVFPSTYDRFKGVTVVSGTTIDGVQYATDLSEDFYDFNGADLFYLLKNNNFFAYLSSVNIGSLSDLMAAEPGQENVLETVQIYTPIPDSAQAAQGNRFNTGTILLLALIVIGIIIILIGLYQLLRNRIASQK